MWINTESFETPQRGLTYNINAIRHELTKEQQLKVVKDRISRDELTSEQIRKIQYAMDFDNYLSQLWGRVINIIEDKKD